MVQDSNKSLTHTHKHKMHKNTTLCCYELLAKTKHCQSCSLRFGPRSTQPLFLRDFPHHRNPLVWPRLCVQYPSDASIEPHDYHFKVHRFSSKAETNKHTTVNACYIFHVSMQCHTQKSRLFIYVCAYIFCAKCTGYMTLYCMCVTIQLQKKSPPQPPTQGNTALGVLTIVQK